MDEKYKINRYSELLDKNKIIRLFSYLLSVLLGMCFINCSNYETSKMEETWREFRALHPYSYQTVALKHYGDTCVFVMSEPDSWVKETDLEQLFDKYDGQLIIRYQPYGFDGQLTDAVGCAIFDSITFDNFEKELFTLLYKTDYKPFYTDLDNPIKHVYYSENYNLNYSISPFIIESELNDLFSIPTQKGDSIEKTVSELLDSDMQSSNEIYFSKERGFVIWVINTDSTIQAETFLQNARRFALDTDLILGSIPKRENTNKIAIVAREREVPVFILPPLKSETILQLSSNTKSDIKLTFDADSIHTKELNDSTFATPISITNWWENTELGNLMVITDVLLKSWSESGKVCDYFMDYPMPDNYPFVNGLSQEVGYIPHYYWNFYYDGETGCMPIDYYPVYPQDSIATETEKEIAFKARMHFANLNCIDIVRATQYSAIYQLFNGLKLYYPKQTESWVKTPSWTISNKPWGFGGYIAQAGGLGKAAKSLGKGLSRPKPFPKPTPRPTPYPVHYPVHYPISSPIFGSATLKHDYLNQLREEHPEISPLLIKYPKLADILIERPSLASKIGAYPFLAESLVRYPMLTEDLDKFPRLSTSLVEHPQLGKVLVKHRVLSKTLSEHPNLSNILAQYPNAADALVEHPDLVGALERHPNLGGALTSYPNLVNILVKYPILSDALTRTPKLANALEKYPMLADELAKITNLSDLSARNPHFADLLSKYPKVGLRESMNISPSTDVQRGLDTKTLNAPTSSEYVLSKPQMQEILDISNQKISKMIDMRLQIKQQINKLGIHVKEVKWEINNTLRAFIIIEQYEEGSKQAA